MKRGFTLIELMVVVGIMAFLGVAATGGYSALQRGMSERGAVAAVSSLLKAAKERALVDRSPTVVYCYNRLLREATDVDNAVVVGEAVAIRRAGRISMVPTANDLIDEFLDVEGCYDVVEEAEVLQHKGMKLWRFADSKGEMGDMRYSIVADAVYPWENSGVLRTFGGWAEGYDGGNTNMPFIAYAFRVLSVGSSHKATDWKAGTGYGFEFATVQLPKNFVFGSRIPSRLGDVEMEKSIYFDPESASDNSVEIQFCMPDASGLPKAHHNAGTASSKENQTI